MRSTHPTLVTETQEQYVLQRDFTAASIICKWVTDVTYLATQQGWLYLAAVLDLFSRALVGWSMSAVQDEQLVINALMGRF